MLFQLLHRHWLKGVRLNQWQNAVEAAEPRVEVPTTCLLCRPSPAKAEARPLLAPSTHAAPASQKAIPTPSTRQKVSLWAQSELFFYTVLFGELAEKYMPFETSHPLQDPSSSEDQSNLQIGREQTAQMGCVCAKRHLQVAYKGYSTFAGSCSFEHFQLVCGACSPPPKCSCLFPDFCFIGSRTLNNIQSGSGKRPV